MSLPWLPWLPVFALDLLFLPFHVIINILTRRRERRREFKWVEANEDHVEVAAPLVTSTPVKEVKDMMVSNPTTMVDFFQYCVNKHNHNKCLGYRQVLNQVEEFGVNGNLVSKKVLGEYNW